MKYSSHESVRRDLTEIGEEMIATCYYEKLRKTEPFAHAFLRNLFAVKRLQGEDEKMSLEVSSGLFIFIVRLSQTDYITADYAERTSLELILRRVREAKWGFSYISRLMADSLYVRFENQNWGKVSGEPLAEGDQSSERYRMDSHGELSPTDRFKMLGNSQMASGKVHVHNSIPAEDDPIFGVDGPMYGTMIKISTTGRENPTKSLVLNPAARSRNPKVFGHNGIKVGKLYLRQMAALAQGAHGASQAGISGTAEDGAFSIVVTGRYSSLDKDGLDRVEYCATGSINNTLRDALVLSQGLKMMRTSRHTCKPVRVLRGQNDRFQYAPDLGLRYDGLYTVTDEKRSINHKGGLYAVFILERNEVQDPVDLTRPNAMDYHHSAQLKKMLK